jgi:hypothetical protein
MTWPPDRTLSLRDWVGAPPGVSFSWTGLGHALGVSYLAAADPLRALARGATLRAKIRVLQVAFLVALLASCGAGATTGEMLASPFAGTVLSAAPATRCSASQCMSTYKVRITNPTDRDADVQDCGISPLMPGLERLPIMGIAGLSIPAGATRTTTARFLLPIGRGSVGNLAGRLLSCTGIDWHGSSPI